jgi:hypothetical protein
MHEAQQVGRAFEHMVEPVAGHHRGQAERCRQAPEDAFTFRIEGNGEDATPAFSGLSA